MMKRSSLAPPPPAKRSRAPGESDIGDEDDGRVSSESTLRPGKSVLWALLGCRVRCVCNTY
jgi:hypothetical protein